MYMSIHNYYILRPGERYAIYLTPRILCNMLPSNPSTSASETEFVVNEEKENAAEASERYDHSGFQCEG